MKVVLFCGGLGIRLRERSELMPKPMLPIGYRPLLWHVMRYYAHFGHKDFVLCLGHRADMIKRYFLDYEEALSNDFVLSDGGRSVELLGTDIEDWTITFADTGLRQSVGGRLKAVQPLVGGDEVFLATYADGLTDAPLDELIERFLDSGKVAGFLSVRPNYSYHAIDARDDGVVTSITSAAEASPRLNGGYFMFRREIFEYIGFGEDLVAEPFQRLISEEQLVAYRYDGFWAPMDTLKEMQQLEELFEAGRPPWAVWRSPGDDVRQQGEGSARRVPS